MKFSEAKIKGAFLIEIDKIEDDRGFFARSFCQKEFAKLGLENHIEQCNVSFNKNKGTLRGMHYQKYPVQEVKIVRCIKGKIYDVIVDLRSESPTYKQWEAFELDATSYKMVYIPKGAAHGYMSLETDSEILYYVSAPYSPAHYGGFRWNDPAFNIEWPMVPTTLSEKDKNHPIWAPDVK